MLRLWSKVLCAGNAIHSFRQSDGPPGGIVLRERFRLCIAFLLFAAFSTDFAATGQESIRVVSDIPYAKVDGQQLRLDLYLPAEAKKGVPCVVFIHGGGWKNGDRSSGKKNAAWLTEHGFAVASIDYRLTDVAQWPAQIEDCYAAVRWIREHGQQHGIDPSHIGAWGTSAGGHLAALLGTRPDPSPESVSSRVDAVCDWFGPTELLTMPPNNIGDGRTAADVANSNGAKLLGATVRDVPERARDASALVQVSQDDAAFLIMHGQQDPGVPLSQSQRLHAALVKTGIRSRLHVIPGAGHGGKEFQTSETRAIVARFFRDTLKSNWFQGPGPNGNFRVSNENAPVHWSVVQGDHIRWKKTVPETGQSTVIACDGRIYFTTIKPINKDALVGSDIVAWCCDASTGETIWTKQIAGGYPLRLSGCFSDSSSPPPVTDGKNVCFFNASGRIACFDLDGNPKWNRERMPVGRSQPTLIDQNVVFIRQRYMPDAEGNFTHEHEHAPLEQWTQVQAIEIDSGEVAWTSNCGANMGCVPLPMTLSDGRRVMILGRGGGHSPPEKPEGISMIDASDGSTIWTLELPQFMSTMTFNVVGDQVLVFDRGDHLWVNAMTGKIERRVSIVDRIAVREHRGGEWSTRTESIDIGNKTRAIIQQSNVVAGRFHYFRSYTQPWIGRVDIESGTVEHLQLPVQMRRTKDALEPELLWGFDDVPVEVALSLKETLAKPPKTLPIQQWAFIPNDMKNSRGFVAMGDKRSMGNGWGHHASQVPTVVGDRLYVPTMSGTVYVLKWDVDAA